MLARVPEDYDQNYLTMSRRGARVLALGWRDLGPLSHQELKVQVIGWLPECFSFRSSAALCKPFSREEIVALAPPKSDT